MSVTKSEVIAALDLAAKLEALGHNVAIAGGFCRDVYFIEPPKDVDIVVAVRGREDMERISQALSLCEVTHQAFHMYNETLKDRIVGGFKCVGNVDVVLYTVPNAAEAVSHFDFNLNQFILLGGWDLNESYVVYAGDTSWHELEPVRKDYTEERFGRMREKWLNLSWRYPEGEGPSRVYLRDIPFRDKEDE